LINETWKDVVGYEGIYEVSNLGQVRTHENKTTFTEKHGLRKWKQRILKQKTSKDNCRRVSLWNDGKEQTWLVHRLVAFAFIPTIENKLFINHIDGDRLNNNVTNLEWCNHKENNNHAFDTDLMTSNIKIVLVHKVTKQPHYFRSMSKASEFLDCNNGFISGQLKRGKSKVLDYDIFIQPEKELSND